MAAEISMYVCDDQVKAATARQILLGQGYADADITAEQSAVTIYDANRYDGGQWETTYNKFIVIGKK